MPDEPRLPRFPLAVTGTRFATVVQDSEQHIRQRVTCLLQTPVGWRDDYPDLGLTRQEFKRGGPDLAEIEYQIATYEPRVDLDVDDLDVTFNDNGSVADVTLRLNA